MLLYKGEKGEHTLPNVKPEVQKKFSPLQKGLASQIYPVLFGPFRGEEEKSKKATLSLT